jgi:hypothetical protein
MGVAELRLDTFAIDSIIERMKRSYLVVVIGLSCALLFSWALPVPAAADAYEEKVFLITGDLFILRPVGVAALAGGSALYALAWPWAALTGSTKETANVLIKKPYRFTFRRPLGTKIEDE